MPANNFDINLAELQALEAELPLDEMFDVLSDRYARYTLYYLSEQPTTTLDQLADVVAGFEAMETDAVVAPVDHERIRIRLYHAVVPKLDAVGYVEFDVENRTVSRASVPPRVYSLLGVASDPGTDGRAQ